MELETFFNASAQAKLFLLSCAFGIPIGVVFDGFRAIRLLLPHNRVLVMLEDILFFVLYGIFVLCFTLTAARGQLRLFYLLGNVLGFCVYYCTVGVVVIGVLRRLFGWLQAPILAAHALICKKVKLVFVRTRQNMRKRKKTVSSPLIDSTDLMYNKNTNEKSKDTKKKRPAAGGARLGTGNKEKKRERKNEKTKCKKRKARTGLSE